METEEEIIEILTPKVEIKPSDSLKTRILEKIQDSTTNDEKLNNSNK